MITKAVGNDFEWGTTPSGGRYEGAAVGWGYVGGAHSWLSAEVPKPLQMMGIDLPSIGCGSLFYRTLKVVGISFNQQMPKLWRVLDPLPFGPDETGDVVPDLLKIFEEAVRGNFTDHR